MPDSGTKNGPAVLSSGARDGNAILQLLSLRSSKTCVKCIPKVTSPRSRFEVRNLAPKTGPLFGPIGPLKTILKNCLVPHISESNLLSDA